MNLTSKNELEKYKKLYNCDNSIADLTPTVCRLMNVPVPEQCGADDIAAVTDQAERLTGKTGGIEKTLIFCPDAVGEVHRQKYPELLKRVENLAGFRFLSSSVMPSVTPVCFASIFSGASPEVHGIQKYEKPVLEIETLFDVLTKSGKNVAIVSVNTCSIDCIFRKRDIDYYSLRNDESAHKITRQLLCEDKYDVILSYFFSYDGNSHKYGCWSPEAVGALEKATEYFENLVSDTEKYWSKYNRAVIWAPDHGNHMVNEQHGGHGQNIADDMVVNHYYRIMNKK